MKISAENASRKDGGATTAATLLKDLCDAGPTFTLHAVGHSAGAIFHRFFLDRARRVGVPSFKTLSLLAPAITVDEFTRGLMPLVGDHIQSVRMYTMHREYERADVCEVAGVDLYHKSLLYLIHHALEREPRTPILGLEDSVVANPETQEFFREDRAPEEARIVWSVGPGSASTSHGGFDNDAATMNNLIRHICDVPEPTKPFSMPRDVEGRGRTPRPAVRRRSGPRRAALCIGINAYPTNALKGCVADAEEWADVLNGLGFETTMLVDGNATRAKILDAIEGLVDSIDAGDVGVVQYSGHGTQVADTDGDELSDRLDEALVPVDFDRNAFIIDDDLRNIFASLRTGANLTCFMDCCFSESNTRFLRVEQPRRSTSARVTPRFLPRSDERDRLHRRSRARRRSCEGTGSAVVTPTTHVSFSACRDFQVALESNGHGHFTVAATDLLRHPDALSWTNAEFFQRILGAIEPGQTPTLEPSGDSRLLLATYATAADIGVPVQLQRSPNGRSTSRGVSTTPA
ncbi:MAG: caspase family protein, partial [Gordonia polyisoprenivorans]|nr:caspase family protein [Gordonia polyisoprenivorans]